MDCLGVFGDFAVNFVISRVDNHFSQRSHSMISILLNPLRFILWPRMKSILVKVIGWKRMCVLLSAGWGVL